MKRLQFIIATFFACITCVVLLSCSKTDTYDNSGGAGVLYKVSILAAQFDPANTTMLVNHKITWTNMDTETHSIVSDDATSFNSGSIAAGGSFSFTPTATGTFPYHCGVHPTVRGALYVVNK